jgi:hypothetical protein
MDTTIISQSSPETGMVKGSDNPSQDSSAPQSCASTISVKTRLSFSSFILMLITTVLLNAAVTASMLYYYHSHYATKIIAFDFASFKNTLVNEIVSGRIKGNESDHLLNNLRNSLNDRTEGTNTLILLKEVIVNGNVEEIDPGIHQLLQK